MNRSTQAAHRFANELNSRYLPTAFDPALNRAALGKILKTLGYGGPRDKAAASKSPAAAARKATAAERTPAARADGRVPAGSTDGGRGAKPAGRQGAGSTGKIQRGSSLKNNGAKP